MSALFQAGEAPTGSHATPASAPAMHDAAMTDADADGETDPDHSATPPATNPLSEAQVLEAQIEEQLSSYLHTAQQLTTTLAIMDSVVDEAKALTKHTHDILHAETMDKSGPLPIPQLIALYRIPSARELDELQDRLRLRILFDIFLASKHIYDALKEPVASVKNECRRLDMNRHEYQRRAAVAAAPSDLDNAGGKTKENGGQDEAQNRHVVVDQNRGQEETPTPQEGKERAIRNDECSEEVPPPLSPPTTPHDLALALRADHESLAALHARLRAVIATAFYGSGSGANRDRDHAHAHRISFFQNTLRWLDHMHAHGPRQTPAQHRREVYAGFEDATTAEWDGNMVAAAWARHGLVRACCEFQGRQALPEVRRAVGLVRALEGPLVFGAALVGCGSSSSSAATAARERTREVRQEEMLESARRQLQRWNAAEAEKERVARELRWVAKWMAEEERKRAAGVVKLAGQKREAGDGGAEGQRRVKRRAVQLGGGEITMPDGEKISSAFFETVRR